MNGHKYGISDNQLTAALVTGFLATQIATIVGFWHEIIDLPAMDWNRFNGTYLVGFSNPTAIGFEVPPPPILKSSSQAGSSTCSPASC